MSTVSTIKLILLLITNVLGASITENVDHYLNLHSAQVKEEIQAKLNNFESMMESEMNKMKQKINILDTKVQEQDILLKNNHGGSVRARQSDNDMPLTEIDRTNQKRGFVPKTCLEAYNADPSLESGMYWIDPDGQGRGDNPIYVYCNMTTGSTSVLHDSEETIYVGHCLDPGCYSRQIKYNATLRQLTMLSELSNECQQSIQVNCFDAALEFNGVAYAWWNDRNGDPRYFWTGNNKNSSGRYHLCQCGLDGTCNDKSLLCNCDSDLAIELADTGIITDKDLLPVTKLNFGRTIAPTSSSQHTLGRLECSGNVVLNGMPTSCEDLWRTSYTLSGIYLIKGSSSKVDTVYCDFSKLPGDQGLQTWIGYSDVKKMPVYFNVLRNSSYENVNTVLLYDVELMNIGNGLNTSSGIFTAPRSGIYYFSFVSDGDARYPYIWLNLQINDVQVATCNQHNVYTCIIPYTVELNPGDRVQLFLIQGIPNNVIFTGWLVAENVFDSLSLSKN